MKTLKASIFIWALAFAAMSATAVFGQLADPKNNYGGWTGEYQTRNIPAGTVQDPGSHLTYILDTGINARQLLRKADGTADVNLATATATPLVDLAQFVDQNGDGLLDPGSIFQNFVAVTNTHPTMAVTVHFRYFNDNCEDVLDFLVVLTCNDTLIFDPFNFEIPASGGENTRDRIIGPARPGRVLTPVPTAQYGSGRFVLTAAASGTSFLQDGQLTANDDVNILFPFELRDLAPECNINFASGSNFDGSLAATLAGTVGNVGTQPGLVRRNLHVFNAAQIAFDFLIGHQTVAVPVGLITDPGAVSDLAYGMTAWVRPSVNRSDFDNNVGFRGWPDGDAPQVATGKILLGGELGFSSGNPVVSDIARNQLYLRNEVHGGDVSIIGQGGDSHYGALAATSFHITSPRNTVMHFLSATDDYNGSSNAGSDFLDDRSANITTAATTFVLQIYDNDENLLTFVVAPPINVSPPVFGEVVNLKMVCICLRTFLTSTIAPGTSVDDVTIQDMADVFGAQVLNGLGDFAGLLQPSAADASGGWIRFVRDNTNQVDITASINTAVGLGFVATAHGFGTSTFNLATRADTLFGPSFLVFGQHLTKFQGFGAGWHLQAAASDPRVSDLGTEDPD